jgi:phenylpropionate dioxygenase-like ring-hydroxylating dioxygenase large terminal subunit
MTKVTMTARALPRSADERLCTDSALIDDWHVVAFSGDLQPGSVQPVRLLGRELVMWRDQAGSAHVWEDLCIHRGSRLSKGCVVDDTVVCPYHGWRYDGSGACVLIPATPSQTPPTKARAFSYRVAERYGFIWASLGDPPHDIPEFPEWQDEGFVKVHAGPYLWRSSGFRSVENFLDATHFPFVHAGVNGVMSEPDEIGDYEVIEDERGLRSTEIQVFQPYGDPREVPVHVGYSYRCMRPLVAYFSKRVEVADKTSKYASDPRDRFCTFFTAQPIDETSCCIRICTARNFSPELTVADVHRRQDLVYSQDRDIVETQRPERIPLDLREELHHRTDRLGFQYRRWLDRLQITYGAV